MNYIKMYKHELGLQGYNTKLWQIHHINMNRDDNRIENLVCIPKALHERLHSAYNKIIKISQEKILDIEYIIYPYDYQNIKDYIEIKSEIHGFIMARNHLKNKNINSEQYMQTIIQIANMLGYEV